MSKEKVISIKMDSKLWKIVKKNAICTNTTASEVIEKLIRQEFFLTEKQIQKMKELGFK